MSRAWIYLAVVLVAGLTAGWWFVSTEEVDPAATEPAAFDFFLLVFTVAAMAGAFVVCLAAEIAMRLIRRHDRTSA